MRLLSCPLLEQASANEMQIEFSTVVLSIASGSQKRDISFIIDTCGYPAKIENKLCFCTTLNDATCMAE